VRSDNILLRFLLPFEGEGARHWRNNADQTIYFLTQRFIATGQQPGAHTAKYVRMVSAMLRYHLPSHGP
jgi:hypothetical protein